MTLLTRLLALANRQHRLVTVNQLRVLGYSKDGIEHLVHARRLWRVHRGVYALEGPLTPEAHALAAVMRMSPDAYASHLTAAALLGYRDRWPFPPSVTVVGRDGARGPNNITVHRSSTLTETSRCRGIPLTAPARTIIDCARHLDDPSLKALLRRAEYNGFDLTSLDRPRLPRNLRGLLDRYVIGSGLTANELEARFFEICAAAGLPRPEIQARLTERRRIDFVWHDIRLIVETDGRRSHDSFIAFTDDRTRDRDHFFNGYTTLRFTWYEVEHEPSLLKEQLVQAHARLRS